MAASWAELFRWFLDDGAVDPLEVRRRSGRVGVNGLRVLDLTDEHVRDALDVGEDDLISDDYGTCQALADAAAMAGFDGILAPAAAMPGARTLVVFSPAVARAGTLVPLTQRVGVPPINLVDRLGTLRPKDRSKANYVRYVRHLARLSRSELRRRYGRRAR